MAMKINTTNKVTKVYKSKAVENLEDSYMIKLLKQKYGNYFPISKDMIAVKRFGVMLYRILNGKVKKNKSFKYIEEIKELLNLKKR